MPKDFRMSAVFCKAQAAEGRFELARPQRGTLEYKPRPSAACVVRRSHRLALELPRMSVVHAAKLTYADIAACGSAFQ